MPIYEFECKSCGHVFEKLFLGGSVNSKSVKRRLDSQVRAEICPNCGQLAKRVMSTSNFILKGAGFYKNDYGSGSVSESVVKDEEKKNDD